MESKLLRYTLRVDRLYSEIPICCGVRGPVGKQRNGAVY